MSLARFHLGLLMGAAARQASAFDLLIGRAAAWYDGRSMAAVTDQSVVNSADGAGDPAVRGSTAGVDTNDPTFLDHDGDHYVYLPGTASNSLSTPRPYASTHFTITWTDDTTTVGTTTADPVVIGGTAHSGQVKSVVLRETDGAGDVGATATPVADIDTGSDPDAGQSSFVSSVSAETWTVNRAATGLKTAVVTRPVWLFDGTDDYIQLPASDTPTFTATSGQFTVLIAFRAHVHSGYRTLWSSDDAGYDGMWVYLSSSGYSRVNCGGATTDESSPLSGIRTVSQLHVVAGRFDDGKVSEYNTETGLSASTDTTGVGTISHHTPRTGLRSSGATYGFVDEIFAVLSFPGEALTETQLDELAATLTAGDYTP